MKTQVPTPSFHMTTRLLSLCIFILWMFSSSRFVFSFSNLNLLPLCYFCMMHTAYHIISLSTKYLYESSKRWSTHVLMWESIWFFFGSPTYHHMHSFLSFTKPLRQRRHNINITQFLPQHTHETCKNALYAVQSLAKQKKEHYASIKKPSPT